MGRKMKKLTRAGAGALAGVMVFGLAAPLAPLTVEAADEPANLALGSTATVNDKMKIFICQRQKQHVMYVYILTDIRRMRQMIRQIGGQFLCMTSRSMQMRFLIRFSRMKTTV